MFVDGHSTRPRTPSLRRRGRGRGIDRQNARTPEEGEEILGFALNDGSARRYVALVQTGYMGDDVGRRLDGPSSEVLLIGNPTNSRSSLPLLAFWRFGGSNLWEPSRVHRAPLAPTEAHTATGTGDGVRCVAGSHPCGCREARRSPTLSRSHAAGSVLAGDEGEVKPFMKSLEASGMARPGRPSLGESCAARPNRRANVRST